ncbi:hypothetical protein ABZ532_29530 [Streptomyces sp. NPDC019396]|uniref:hypothetical protein n=1 Tax=Streptomyces sp. NPDC019396 TaxID=3154687 RepID=UPI0034045427
MSFACFLIAWSLSFKLAGLLLKPALTVSTSVYTHVFVQLGLPALFLTFAGVVAGWHLMFGRKARGWGEAAAALVISALAVTTLAAPPQLLLSEQDGAVGTARALAVEVAALVLDNHKAIETPKTTINDTVNDTVPAGSSAGAQVRGNATALARPITDGLVDAFVVRPAMILSYGQTFDDETKGAESCAKRFRDSRIAQAVYDDMVDDALNSGSDKLQELPWIGSLIPDGTTITPEWMQEKAFEVGPAKEFEKDCVKGDAGALKKASMDKVGGAAFMTLAALLVCLFIIVVDGSFLLAQVWIAFEAMLSKVALAVGVLPGPGRAWLWTRATSTLKSLAVMVVAVFSLAVLIVVITAILNSPEKDLPGGLTIRFVVIDLLCIGAFVFRKRLTRATGNLAATARTRLGNSPLGGQAGPSDLGNERPRRSLGRKLLVGGMMLGAMAATGGAAGAGYARGSSALAARLARGTGRMIGGTAKAAVGTTKLAAKGTLAASKLGLKSTVGLPVYGPRAVRKTGAALTAVPGQVRGSVASLGHRIQQVHQQYAPPVADFAHEYAHGVRSIGRLVRGHRPQPYVPRSAPTRPAPVRPPTPVRSSPARPARPVPVSVAAPPARRPRPVPPRVAQPPASPAQAALQVRLHRIRNRGTQIPASPDPPVTRRAARPTGPIPPAPRRGGGGS